MKHKINPAPGFVVVEPTEDDKKIGNAFSYAAEKAPEKAREGIVIAVGPKILVDPDTWLESPVSVSQRVVHRQYGPEVHKINDREVKFVRFQDIFCTLETEETNG